MQPVINYLKTNSGEIINSLGQHLTISFIAAIIAILIAVPLAIILINHRKTGELVLQITSVIQTIPSLAILGLLIPLVGIGTIPAIIALVLYALMPVFANTYAGLTNIDPLLMEAADAFGVSWRFKLFKIQIPLALPMILTGIRQAVVMIIGTATLAALIGGGGLGTYILLGIQTNNNNALIVGAVLAAALALIASGLIRLLAKVPLKYLTFAIIGIFTLAGIGWGVKSLAFQQQETITIAGKMGGEPEILINMYKDIIENDQPQIKVKLKPNFGGTSFLFKGLQSQKIDVYPEFTGTVLQSLVKTDKAIPHQPRSAYQQAQKLLQFQYKMTYLAPMQYQNGYAVVVRRSTAAKYHLHTIADLAQFPGLKAAFDPDFYQQSDGYPGLKKFYHLHFQNVKTMEPALRYEALAKGKVAVTDGYTTDPQIKKYKLVVLNDSRSFFPPYQGAPLVRTEFARSHPQIIKSLNKLQGQITTKQMQTMNYQVTVQHKKASQVAHQFLQHHGFLMQKSSKR